MAGPNGSGKSTLTAFSSLGDFGTVVDPDALARELNPTDSAQVAIAAARKAILECRSLLARRESFVVETTLAGHGALSLLRQAQQAGYRTRVVYVALRDVEMLIERVDLRVAQGGHDVPEVDIRRRYGRSLRHAAEAMRLADESVVFDNSGPRHERMLWLRGGQIVWRAPRLPAWIQDLAGRLE